MKAGHWISSLAAYSSSADTCRDNDCGQLRQRLPSEYVTVLCKLQLNGEQHEMKIQWLAQRPSKTQAVCVFARGRIEFLAGCRPAPTTARLHGLCRASSRFADRMAHDRKLNVRQKCRFNLSFPSISSLSRNGFGMGSL